MNSLVSIVIPLYNYGKYLPCAMKSIFSQSYKKWEVIIVDDCSDDNSYEVAKKYKCDNIRVIRLPRNCGYSKAKNEAIIASKGEFITSHDADDLLTENSLEIRIETIKKKATHMVHANGMDVPNDFSFLDINKIKLIPSAVKRIHGGTVLVVRDFYKKWGLYDELLRGRSDREMWARHWGLNLCDKITGSTKFFIPEVVTFYRQHNLSLSHLRSNSKEYEKSLDKLLRKQCKLRIKEGITSKNTRFLNC